MTNEAIAKQVIDQKLILRANDTVFMPAGFKLVVKAGTNRLDDTAEQVEEMYFITCSRPVSNQDEGGIPNYQGE